MKKKHFVVSLSIVKRRILENSYHVPVLLRETIDNLVLNPDGVYIDATFGAGGHSSAILEKLSDKGRLFSFDQDKEAQNNIIEDTRFTFVGQNFRYIEAYMKIYGIQKVDGILADLGVSSYQFDTPKRGFSTRFDAPLDMRMDTKNPFSAADILKTYDADKLADVLYNYGEIRNSRLVAKEILKQEDLQTTGQLCEVLKKFTNPIKQAGFFAQVFQALRIEVNDEIGALKEFLNSSVEMLKKDGIIAVIAYHSLEDRLVKNFFRTGDFKLSEPEKDFFGNIKAPLKPLNRKPIVASESEIVKNNRARSAKLRIAQKL